jgi:hypothetical protein
MANDEEKSQTGMARVHLRLAQRQYDELKMLADFEGRSVSDIIRQVISAHLRDNQVPGKSGGEA